MASAERYSWCATKVNEINSCRPGEPSWCAPSFTLCRIRWRRLARGDWRPANRKFGKNENNKLVARVKTTSADQMIGEPGRMVQPASSHNTTAIGMTLRLRVSIICHRAIGVSTLWTSLPCSSLTRGISHGKTCQSPLVQRCCLFVAAS